jgi:hypothetical protein
MFLAVFEAFNGVYQFQVFYKSAKFYSHVSTLEPLFYVVSTAQQIYPDCNSTTIATFADDTDIPSTATNQEASLRSMNEKVEATSV